MNINIKNWKVWVLVSVVLGAMGMASYVVLLNPQLSDDLGISEDREVTLYQGDPRPPVVNQFDQLGQVPRPSGVNQVAEQETELVYLRGVLVGMGNGKIQLETDTETMELVLSEETAVRCDPASLLENKGFLDYSRIKRDNQTQVKDDDIGEVIKVGDEVVVTASSSQGQLLVEMMVGFGCEVRELKI